MARRPRHAAAPREHAPEYSSRVLSLNVTLPTSEHARTRRVCRQAAQQDLDEHQAIEEEIRKFEAEHRLRRCPVVGLTANAMSGDMAACLACGMDAYHTKPVRRAELIEVARKYLEAN